MSKRAGRKWRLMPLLVAMLLGLCACGGYETVCPPCPDSVGDLCLMLEEMPEEMPEDFSFSLQWNTHGISSYDSQTGLLVKTRDVVERAPEEYQATLVLPEEQLTEIYGLLRDLGLESYPERFDINSRFKCDPSMTLGVTVRWGEKQHTVTCTDVAFYEDASASLRGQQFLTAHRQIMEILIATPEWAALPEYEVYYE